VLGCSEVIINTRLALVELQTVLFEAFPALVPVANSISTSIADEGGLMFAMILALGSKEVGLVHILSSERLVLGGLDQANFICSSIHFLVPVGSHELVAGFEVMVNELVSKLVNKAIQGEIFIFSSSLADKVGINYTDGEEGAVVATEPVMGAKLSFHVDVILTLPVVLVNPSTVVKVVLGCLGLEDVQGLVDRSSTRGHRINLSPSLADDGIARGKVGASGNKGSPLTVKPGKGQ
jgi:hypothetical protein